MTSGPHETSLMLGELRAQMASLTKAVETQTEKSDAGRAKIYRDLEAIRHDQVLTSHEITAVKSRLDKAEPALMNINAWKERFNGMMMLALFLGGLLGGSVALFWKWIGHKLGVG